ncbi:hypothetical protein DPMN_140501 [Dreissena polymorpha]|uniref:Uncharacterized protein n=1 Tax=Dreissena polymorpha TaxID=45954 RepID=A0A9D4G7Q4_DREPO|nr:hypothetical protein DPMN_140501 [Dreissena polymorpha]
MIRKYLLHPHHAEVRHPEAPVNRVDARVCQNVLSAVLYSLEVAHEKLVSANLPRPVTERVKYKSTEVLKAPIRVEFLKLTVQIRLDGDVLVRRDVRSVLVNGKQAEHFEM